MNMIDVATTALTRRRSARPRWARRRPNLQLSLLDSPLSLGRRQPEASSKLVSLELELGGMAVEFKAKSAAGLLAWLSLDVAALAVLQELMRPTQFRTWHGHVAGLIPYDFRRPTLRRVLNALWAPGNPRLFTDTAFGIGWSLNLAQLPRFLLGTTRPASSSTYSGPQVRTEAR